MNDVVEKHYEKAVERMVNMGVNDEADDALASRATEGRS